MNELIYLGLGSFFTLLILMFIGWVDVAFMKKPIKKLRNDKPYLTYVVVSSWEGMFVLAGIVIGLIMGGHI